MQKAKYVGFANCSQAKTLSLHIGKWREINVHGKCESFESTLDKLIVDSITKRIKSIQLAKHMEDDVKLKLTNSKIKII